MNLSSLALIVSSLKAFISNTEGIMQIYICNERWSFLRKFSFKVQMLHHGKKFTLIKRLYQLIIFFYMFL